MAQPLVGSLVMVMRHVFPPQVSAVALPQRPSARAPPSPQAAHGARSRRGGHTRHPAAQTHPHRHGWHQGPTHAKRPGAPSGRPWGTSATPTSRTIRSGSAGPGTPPTAGPPIAPAGSDRCASGFAVVPSVPDTIVSHAKITKMKDGRTHLAYKAEHAVNMDTGAIVGITV